MTRRTLDEMSPLSLAGAREGKGILTPLFYPIPFSIYPYTRKRHWRQTQSQQGMALAGQGDGGMPPLLSGLSRQRLEDLAQDALVTGRLDKAGLTAAGTTKWLDVPDGPIAQGRTVPAMPGSRREAIARHAAGLD
jgi:hypothetical protein